MFLIGLKEIYKRKGYFNWDQSYPFPSFVQVTFIGYLSQIAFTYLYYMKIYVTELNTLAGACAAISFITKSFYLVEMLRIPALLVFNIF